MLIQNAQRSNKYRQIQQGSDQASCQEPLQQDTVRVHHIYSKMIQKEIPRNRMLQKITVQAVRTDAKELLYGGKTVVNFGAGLPDQTTKRAEFIRKTAGNEHLRHQKKQHSCEEENPGKRKPFLETRRTAETLRSGVKQFSPYTAPQEQSKKCN